MNNFYARIYNGKKAVMIPTIKTFLIIIVTTVILISFILILNEYSKISIDERKINQQLVVNKIFNSNCFSDEYGVIEKDLFTDGNVRECFNGLYEIEENGNIKENIEAIAVSSPNILVRLAITNYEVSESLISNQYIYIGDKDEFDEKWKFSGMNSNVLIHELRYPIIFRNSEVFQEEALLHIDIITY